MNKPAVTAGPWRTEKHPSDPCFAEISGARPAPYKPGKPRENVPWTSFATVVVKMADEDTPSAEGLANLDLIMTSVNACFEINPANPSAVAPEIVPMRDALEKASRVILGYGNICHNLYKGSDVPTKEQWEGYLKEAEEMRSEIAALLQRTGGKREP